MSTSIVAFMIIDQIAQFKYLPQSVDIYNGLAQSECQGRWIYGGYNNLGSGMVLQHTFNLPTHQKVRITATILLEDSWDNEVLKFSVNNNIVQQFTKNVHDGFSGCGNGAYEDKWFDLYWESDYTSDTLVVKFENTLDEATSNESWGFIDFKIFTYIECYYLYTECYYQGTEYIFCPQNPQRSQEKFLQPIKSFRVPQGRELILQDPGFYGGVLQTYTSDQNCIDPFMVQKKQSSFQKKYIIQRHDEYENSDYYIQQFNNNDNLYIYYCHSYFSND